MQTRHFRLSSAVALSVTLALSMLASRAFAKEVSGVDMPDALPVAGKSLGLRGAGVRSMFVFKVYAAGLYADPSAGADVATADVVKCVRMVMMRNVGREKMVDAIRSGFERNSKAQLPQLEGRLAKLAGAMPAELKKGMVMDLTYVPGTGTVISGVGPSLTLEGKDFGDALFQVWLGKNPVDESLKKKLLGH